jgi:mono/diheme cytochrome c family protein
MHSNQGRSANAFTSVAALALIAFAAIVLSACAVATPANTWVKPNQNFKNTRYVGGRITTNTIATVAVGWTADIRTKAGIGSEAPSPFISKNVVFLQTPSGKLAGLDLATGSLAPHATVAANAVFRPTWLSQLKAGPLRKFSSPISPILTLENNDEDDKIVVGAGGDKVVALGLSNSDTEWTSTIKAIGSTKPRVISNMAAAHNKIYVPIANVPTDLASLDGAQLTNKLEGKSSNNGQLVALNSNDGKVAWTKKLASVPLGAATVVNDVVFTSTLDGHVYGFNADNGDQIFESALPAGAVAPIAVSDGTIIVPAGFVHKKGQKAQVVAFTIGGLGATHAAGAPKVEQATEQQTAAPAAPAAPSKPAKPAAAAVDGKSVFTANCAGCHTLADAGTKGTTGPNLDDLKPNEALVVKQVTNGGGGMPAFKTTLSAEEIAAVAKYVSSVAGK